jgi:bis(5'-nucleosidyl)-tetraphosphatase
MITSAGFIVFNPNTKRFLLIRSAKGHWDFPKGHVEKGENILEAALRETKEEAGITPTPVSDFLERIEYEVWEEGKRQKKQVYFFLGTVENENVKLSFEHSEYRWVDYQEALLLLKYQNQRQVIDKAYQHLKKIGLV